ncbi:ethanolamine ammonia-lyase subunit EutC [Mucilaginibacter gynuensis]|uniref:Ethanolamine ammonia-lyase small subunit n=1 Tax=Mucilaginibacter gynuensis TaxID=1302236 RepID=A0ABP8FML8_9SPHI
MADIPDDKPAQSWQSLQQFTAARIALGRAGVSIPVKQSLEFKMAHAHARDAVYSKLHFDELVEAFKQFNLPVVHLHSKAGYREQYLQRPDLGRRLSEESCLHLSGYSAENDIAIIIADGLSATAVNENIIDLLILFLPLLKYANIKPAPICLVEQGRVAIGDDIGSILKAKISLVLLGERPGLSAHDSLGAYLTYNPQPGLTDESRNCISNIRPNGLNLEEAAAKMFYLVQQSLKRQLSGVQLKDDTRAGYFP